LAYTGGEIGNLQNDPFLEHGASAYFPVAHPEGEFMRTRILQMGAAIAALLLALTVSRTETFAGSGPEKCSTTSTDVTSGPNSQGAEATCDADNGAPNKAIAEASGADADATSDASTGSESKATATGTDADATSTAEGGSETKATASGDDADATATATSDGGGGSEAKATALGENSDATADAESGSKAKATANGKDSDATATANGGSQAKATASGDAFATADASSGTQAKATAMGTNSDAEASCENSGCSVTALATNGSTAIGSDTAAPTCTPKNGGKAKVTSPMGNCH
jgi:hypothetical protein